MLECHLQTSAHFSAAAQHACARTKQKNYIPKLSVNYKSHEQSGLLRNTRKKHEDP